MSIRLVVGVFLASLALCAGDQAHAGWQQSQYQDDDGSVVKQTVTLGRGTLRIERHMPDGRVLRDVMPISRSAAVTPPLKSSTVNTWGVEVHCDAANQTRCWSPSVNGTPSDHKVYDDVADFASKDDAWDFVRAMLAQGMTCWPGMDCNAPPVKNKLIKKKLN
jgi:hypothetical protein